MTMITITNQLENYGFMYRFTVLKLLSKKFTITLMENATSLVKKKMQICFTHSFLI